MVSRYGQYAPTAPPTAPPPTAALVEAVRLKGGALEAEDVESIFESEPTSLALVGMTVGSTAMDALSFGIITSTTLTHVSLRGTVVPIAPLLHALVDCPSVVGLDVSGCGLRPTDAEAIAETLIPSNRAIVAWDVSENGELGNVGVRTLLRALIAASHPIEALGLRACGLDALVDVVGLLEQLIFLRSTDLSGNLVKPEQACESIQKLNRVLEERAKKDPSSLFVPLLGLRSAATTGAATTGAARRRRVTPSPPRTPTPPRRLPTGETPASRQGGHGRRAHPSGTPPRSPSVRVPFVVDVCEGVEEWRRIRDHYNQHIRPAGGTSSPSRGRSPAPPPLQFVLGKRVDRMREHVSPSFVRPTRISRPATPVERRRLAPWKQGQSSRGCVAYVLDPSCDPRSPTYIEIADGGDVSVIQDDPRDMAFEARRCQAAGSYKHPTNAFASNTPREVRFGVDRDQVARRAQAPGPAYYTVPTELDRMVERARQRSRQQSGTGKKLFGSSAEPRNLFHGSADGPGPGHYEIP